MIEPARARFGPNVTFEQISSLAQNGDIGCRMLIEDVATVTGRGLASICAVLNPPLVVVGGRQLLAGEILLNSLEASFKRHSLIKPEDVDKSFHTRIVPGNFRNNHDTALGAAGLILRT